MKNNELRDALNRIFSSDSELYEGRGFMRRIGFGEKPALVNIDFANALTRSGSPFSCDGMDQVIPGVQQLLQVARSKGIPVVFTSTAYTVTDGPYPDTGLWHYKIPVELLKIDSDLVQIDDRIAPEPGEQVIFKKYASGFHGTYLANYLRAAGVDTVIVTGMTMSACVRHTVEDALGLGFRPIVVRECVGDRIAGAVEWNLFDIDAKFGDVESLKRVLQYLEGLDRK